MKFDVFNFKIEINRSKKRKASGIKILNSSSFAKRYFIFVLILVMTMIFLLYNKYKPEYSVGDIATHDIISTNTITYNVNLLNDDIRKEIEENTTKEYTRNDEISNEEISKLNKLLIELDRIDFENDTQLSKFISENKLNLKVDELKVISSKKDFKYYLSLVEILDNVYKKGISNVDDFKKILSSEGFTVTNVEEKFLKNFIKPNLTIDEEKTKERIEENIDKIKNNEITIKTGDIIVKKGDTITQTNIQALYKLGMLDTNRKIVMSVSTILFLIILFLILYIPTKKFLEKAFLSKGFTPTMITLVIVSIINVLATYEYGNSIYITPFYILPVISYILTKDRLFSSFVTIIAYSVEINDMSWFIILSVISIFVIYKSEVIKNRTQIAKNYLELVLFQVVLSIPYSISINNTFNEASQIIIYTILIGIISSIITTGLLPLYENLFKILTDIKLLELGDFSNPLLRKLLVISPGTFHHSLMVGALAERAAESIGADAIFTRVASYYHDIGKIKRPKYFVENQFEHINPHDKIDPTLSANIIISHVTDGMIIAKQNNLPNEFIEVIEEHHGTTLVKYFYYKAIEQNEHIDIENFKYPGPKPRRKETVLIMLADSIEAAVRVQKDKRREAIEELVRYLVYNKIEETQLSECELTYSEIEKVIKAFLSVLQGAYHERIEYPNIQGKEKNG